MEDGGHILRALSILTLCTLFLGGCESAKEELGLTRRSPDEFAVTKSAPLEIPRQYSLKPPTPGAPRPQETPLNTQAEQTIFGDTTSRRAIQPGSGESALLHIAGALTTSQHIRQIVDTETNELEVEEVPVAEKLLGMTGIGGKKAPPASIVDAQKEADRLRKNALNGRPVTEGLTPTIKD